MGRNQHIRLCNISIPILESYQICIISDSVYFARKFIKLEQSTQFLTIMCMLIILFHHLVTFNALNNIRSKTTSVPLRFFSDILFLSTTTIERIYSFFGKNDAPSLANAGEFIFLILLQNIFKLILFIDMFQKFRKCQQILIQSFLPNQKMNIYTPNH